jgi:translation initiation factor eIF-2B subunit alpha
MFVEAGIPTKVITDSAVGAFMDEVDLCLVGAEGVMENGGIVNKVSLRGVSVYFCLSD